MDISYTDLLGTWEIVESEVPGLVAGSEVYHFMADYLLMVEITDDKGKQHRMQFKVKSRADGLNLYSNSGKKYVEWHLEWHGEVLRLSHHLHSFTSLLRRRVVEA